MSGMMLSYHSYEKTCKSQTETKSCIENNIISINIVQQSPMILAEWKIFYLFHVVIIANGLCFYEHLYTMIKPSNIKIK